MANRASTPQLQAVAPGIWGLRNVFTNLYYVREPEAPTSDWVLVDAGLPGSAGTIRRHAAEIFGSEARPAVIILTHGHFDHVGALLTLANEWDVPVYAHPLELPYLTGRSSYPPPDPTVGGGAMAAMSFLYPKKPIDLGSRVQALPTDGLVPHMPGWRWYHTPGHTPGHVAFFREHDRVLLAGDAFVTVKQESGSAVWEQRQEVHGPPAYFTPNWPQARQSVALLADLKPQIAATGHGIPMHGTQLLQQLQALVDNFDEVAIPKHGRYVSQPATADETGVTSVPPAVTTTFSKWALGLGLAATVALVLVNNKKGKKRYRR
ncbi:MBL fold metallo-hydrolase [Hymenobacter sp. BT188]|uniref:MBL fold metallo-hydrolase n=1 Tax=Hymenobacter sp. BT188 TaxID=2763504 RepID=UPI00165100BB|nr:MBL fold metallo-hydrolase [Hymenobacter sp. BT188]MBC6606760.1 MBL fold metallo-hydrolase [Hymenobacter sp. BT188]